MYKIKLQELCQKRQWGLPRYESSKVGSDHDPRFAAAVFVNGVEFRSDEGHSEFFRSSKEAQNGAARVAFLHFSASQPPPPPLASAAPPCEISSKNQLQSFAQKMNMNLPIYGSVRDGPPHAPRFKATVFMDNQTFESPEFFPTLKEAENAAARVALEALSPLGPESIPFKNLLQEFCLKEGLKYPIYATESSGSSHSLEFISTVDIDGEKFRGVPAKTKKQAEILAAKAALSVLKAGKLCSQPASSLIVKSHESLQNSSNCSSSIVGNCLMPTDTVISPLPVTAASTLLPCDPGRHLPPDPSPAPTFVAAEVQSSAKDTMYKIQLQELCQKRQWGLPRYEVSKVGSDHAPRFAAAVFVNGVKFGSDEGDSEVFRSSKEAQNDAARVAFLHFSASQPPPLASAAPTCEITSKNQLQSFTQKMNMNLPVYGSVRDGPPHAPRFKANVVIDSRTFESPKFFPTLKEAEYAAAKVALEALSPLGPEGIPFKNLLQEFCLKEGLKYPIYATESSGPSHLLEFISTVDIDGEKFPGVPVKTKKQAEILAAKAALSILKARRVIPKSGTIFDSYSGVISNSGTMFDSDSGRVISNSGTMFDSDSGRVVSNSGTMFDSDSGSEGVYKNLLQRFAQRKNIALPVYECVREGPSHSPSFKASVTVDGQTFETTGFSYTIKEAEQAAARIAFETLTHGALDQKELTPPFKILLQELCSKQGLCLPIYETSSTGSSHFPVFISNVKVDDETFRGKPAKSKKLAELFAAELGWATLKKRKERTGKSFDSQISEIREALERSTLCSTSVIMNDTSENSEVIVDQFRTMQLFPHGTGMKLAGSSSKDKLGDGIDLLQQSCRPMTELNFSQNLASTGERDFSDVEKVLDSSLRTKENKNTSHLENNFSDSFNKILVFSRASSVQPPSNAVKLPIQDDKWMAVQFECPAGTA